MKALTYRTDAVSIGVRPSASGVATIYDKEIVLYIASLMAAKIEADESVAQDFVFTAHDLFSVTGANHGARCYGRLSEALERLQGTQIKTNIEAGGEGEEGFFSWLSEAKLHYSRTRGGERRSGSDVVKALALGARAVGIGRPYAYGLALDGAAGCAHVLRCILAEADLLMAVNGWPSIAAVRAAGAVRI